MSSVNGPDSNKSQQELAIFHDVAKALTSSLNLDSILQTIMEKMAAYFEPRRAVITSLIVGFLDCYDQQ